MHLVAVISWMVGLLYLPRLFVYHNEKKFNSDSDRTFILMEQKLLKIIMNPAMLITYILGLTLLYENSYLIYENYFLYKLFLVFLLSLFHFYLTILYKDFKKGYRCKKTSFYKKINEIPTVIMISIILLIIVKPNLP